MASILLAVSGVAGDVKSVFSMIGVSFGPICARWLPTVAGGRRWAGPRSGFNPAGWISWVVGFAVGASDLAAQGVPGLQGSRERSRSAARGLVVGFCSTWPWPAPDCKAARWRCPRASDSLGRSRGAALRDDCEFAMACHPNAGQLRVRHGGPRKLGTALRRLGAEICYCTLAAGAINGPARNRNNKPACGLDLQITSPPRVLIMKTKTRTAKIKETKHHALKDRLSRLTYSRACQLMGTEGPRLIRQGAAYQEINLARDGISAATCFGCDCRGLPGEKRGGHHYRDGRQPRPLAA